MTTVLGFVLAFILCVVGILGCFVPVLPGPPIAWLGVLMAYLVSDGYISGTALIVYAIVTVITVILDYVIPSLGVKFFGGTKYGKWGSFIGTLAGLFFLPWGLIIGPFAGAVIGELVGEAQGSDALKSGFGSLIGFLFGVLLKFVVCVYFLVIVIMSIVATAGGF